MAMTARMLPRSRLEQFVARLIETAQVIAPRRLGGGDVFYGPISSASEVAWDYSTAVEPLKRFFLPQRETVLRFSSDERMHVEPQYDEQERVFLGVRGCDVAGIEVLDAMFGGEITDPYYMNRRERSTLIALTCQEPDWHCFCVCCEAGPFLTKGYDQQWTALPDGMLIEIGSQRGAALADANGDLLVPAEVEHVAARHRLAREAEQKFGEHHAYVAAAMRKLSMKEVDPQIWDQASDRCVECGGCTFLCPTCSCFTVTDRWEGEEGLRERHWDACLYSCYAREASGHNPRPERADRMAARFFHKLSYQWAQRNQRHACVGCGRCVVACMGWAHMPAVSEGIRRGAIK
jgi:sulfhydrogenase subunit beta (sulfur reductase)